MELEQRAGSLNRHASDLSGRPGDVRTLLQLGFSLAGMGALVAFLATTIGWFWHALGWLGVLYAVLLSWILLGAGLITYRDLFHPSWLTRSRRLAPRSIAGNHAATLEPRWDREAVALALRDDFFAFRNEVTPKIDVLESSVVPVVRAHARMILLLTDRDRFADAVAEFEKLAKAINGNFLRRDPATQYADRSDSELGQARLAITALIKDDFGEDVDLWPDLKPAEIPPLAAPNDGMIADPARQREYRDFHRRYGIASRLIKEFKAKYNSEMERLAEIVSAYARGQANSAVSQNLDGRAARA